MSLKIAPTEEINAFKTGSGKTLRCAGFVNARERDAAHEPRAIAVMLYLANPPSPREALRKGEELWLDKAN